MKKSIKKCISCVLIMTMVFSCVLTTTSSVYAGTKRTNKKVKKVTLTNVVGKQIVLGKGKN